mmetsp:Transcript_22214/g.36323  ORF Transcript_22214/g.36323 Transcript_22214/m.36323 type:complete len:388 (+) Transcript_22214:84-1247(+)
MNGNKSEKGEKESSSTQLAGFAPASRGTKSSSSSARGGGGAQSSSSSSSAAAPSASSEANVVDTTNHRITKKKAAATKNPSAAAAATKKRSKSSISAAAAAAGSGSIDGSSNNNNSNYNEATTIQPIDPSTMNSTSFQPMSLSQIQLRIKSLLDELPSALPDVPPDHINPDDDNIISQYYPPIKSFASSLQTTIEAYNLLLSLVSSATYQWGVDRSGASQQNLSVMNSELQQCQEVITSVISGRLSNVLCPAVDVLVGRVEIVKAAAVAGDDGGLLDENEVNTSCKKKKKRKLDSSTAATNDSTDRLTTSTTSTTTTNTNEQRINHYTRPLVDPSYVHLCYQIVARNGEMLRYTLATCIHTAQRVIGDYLKAMKKDVGHEANKGGYY